MKLRWLFAAVLTCVSVFAQQESAVVASPTAAVVPRLIRFSGQLTESNKTVGITFTLHASQKDDRTLWTETQNVKVDATGKYTVLLGATKADGIPMEMFASGEAQWLGIRIEGQKEQSRVLLVSVPYALKAAEAETLAGHSATEFVTSEKLSVAVHEELNGQSATSTPGTTKTADPKARTSVVSAGATNFSANTADQVVKVTQVGTGSALIATSPQANAVLGSATTATAYGVTGSNTASTGVAVGVRGTTVADNGISIYGTASGTTGTATGVKGITGAPNGYGVFGQNTSTTGPAIGFRGATASSSGTAIYGTSTAGSGLTIGLRTSVASADGTSAVLQNTAGGKILSGQSGGALTEVFSVSGTGDIAATGLTTTGNITAGGGFHGNGATLSNVVVLDPAADQVADTGAADTSGAAMIALNGVTHNGSTANNAYFHVQQDSGALFSGTLGIGKIPATGAGYRMMWHPYKAAFRVGGVTATDWDDPNIGFYSFAGGHDTLASAFGSFAFGDGTLVSGTDAVGFGNANHVTGTIGLAIGASNYASGFGSTAIGYTEWSQGQGSVAIGYRTGACNDYVVALGHRATNDHAQADAVAPPCSTAGTPSGYTGTFIWGDESTTNNVANQANNEFRIRASGGVRLRTSVNASSALGTNSNTGCDLPAGSGVFSCASSRTVKENFAFLRGTDVLARLRAMPVSTWNYKAEGAEVRHMGPVAEDFRAAFGLGENETTVGVNDLAGVSLAAAKALDEENARLKKELREQKALIKALNARLTKLEQSRK
ncbi:Hep_Hag [Candidatus Koribacter versatilis Ellin345]|uniref:Hep_Hag n=1 Tax=Koribacter versatilis (strain Ellin345) TaxID=204669 RepID=Q1IKY0_KORVE|nr:tail fiber domain-containing protein [Candidatus Koribacter versatilis]ABF42470.1 Hep_Hag [Candidatus Koribacter versatilis Ellin345]